MSLTADSVTVKSSNRRLKWYLCFRGFWCKELFNVDNTASLLEFKKHHETNLSVFLWYHLPECAAKNLFSILTTSEWEKRKGWIGSSVLIGNSVEALCSTSFLLAVIGICLGSCSSLMRKGSGSPSIASSWSHTFLHLKKRSALELPKLAIFGQPSLSFSWVMNSSIKLKASTNHTASLVRAIVIHIAYAHQGAGCIEDSQRLTDHTLAITFSTQLPNGLRWEEWYLWVKTLRKWWDPWTPQVSIPFLPRQWGTGGSHWHQPAHKKSKNCVFDCTKTQNFDKLIQKRDAWFNPSLNSFFFNHQVYLLYIYLSFIFYWKIIALRRFVSFCCTTMWISYSIHISFSSWSSLPPTHLTALGHHRALSWAPCAIQQLPTSYLFYLW